jgi:hypothetical protein
MAEAGFRPLRWLGGCAAVVILALAAYTWGVLHWSYSSGERAGYVQKLSKKGWLCKTWEGELALVSMPGTVAEKFPFTVHDDAVARRINETIGSRVALTYDQHVGIPSTCFGETGYFVTAIKVVADPGFVPGGGQSAPPVPVPGR